MITRPAALLLDEVDRTLLSLLQESFPLSYEPYRELGTRAGVAEEEALQRIRRLRQEGVIRHIGALFNNAALGYRSTLVAFSIPPSYLDQAGEIISRHPGVSHNYARDHERYNLWFTLTLPPEEDLGDTIADLQKKANARAAMNLPMVHQFKLRVYFDLSVARDGGHRSNDSQRSHPQREAIELTPQEKELVRELQKDLSLKDLDPFGALESRLNMGKGTLTPLLEKFLERGIMRRFSAQLNHRAIGFQANALTCWVASSPHIQEAGKAMSSFDAVSHCYQRPDYPDWPYNIYAMVHGPTKNECEATVTAMAVATGLKDYCILYSVKEYKKSRISLFQ